MTTHLSDKLIIAIGFVMRGSGCASREIRKTIRTMCKAELALPMDMLEITDGIVKPYKDENINRALMVIYYDNAECGSCRISKLNMLDTLFRLSETTNKFQMLVVFSPKEEELQEILSLLRDKHYQYPIALDVSNDFCKFNPFIPDDSRFHSFLTDSNRKPIFIGNPLYSSELWDMFMERLNN